MNKRTVINVSGLSYFVVAGLDTSLSPFNDFCHCSSAPKTLDLQSSDYLNNITALFYWCRQSGDMQIDVGPLIMGNAS